MSIRSIRRSLVNAIDQALAGVLSPIRYSQNNTLEPLDPRRLMAVAMTSVGPVDFPSPTPTSGTGPSHTLRHTSNMLTSPKKGVIFIASGGAGVKPGNEALITWTKTKTTASVSGWIAPDTEFMGLTPVPRPEGATGFFGFARESVTAGGSLQLLSPDEQTPPPEVSGTWLGSVNLFVVAFGSCSNSVNPGTGELSTSTSDADPLAGVAGGASRNNGTGAANGTGSNGSSQFFVPRFTEIGSVGGGFEDANNNKRYDDGEAFEGKVYALEISADKAIILLQTGPTAFQSRMLSAQNEEGGKLTSPASRSPGSGWSYEHTDGIVYEFYPNGQFKVAVLPDGKLVTATYASMTGANPSGLLQSVSFDDDGVLYQTAYTYNAGTDQVATVTQTRAGQAYRHVAYQYDALGRANHTTVRNGGATGPIVERQFAKWVMNNGTQASYLTISGDNYERALDYVGGNPSDLQTASLYSGDLDDESSLELQLLRFVDGYFEFDTSGRVTRRISSGQGAGCAFCGATGLGHFRYSYTDNPRLSDVISGSNQPNHANDPVDENDWHTKMIETRPDGSSVVYFSNASGQVILEDREDALSGTHFRSYTRYAQGHVVMRAGSAAVTGYDENQNDLIGFSRSTGHATGLNNSGLIHVNKVVIESALLDTESASAMPQAGEYFLQAEASPGPRLGRTLAQYEQVGEGISNSPLREWTYINHGTSSFVSSVTDFHGRSAAVTSYDYLEWYGGSNGSQFKVRQTKLPKVSAAQNGADADGIGSSTSYSLTEVFDAWGRVVWSKDANGHIDHWEHDALTGQRRLSVRDAITDPVTGYSGALLPTGQDWKRAAGLSLKNTYTLDSLGRVITEVDANNSVTHYVYDDSRYESEGIRIVRTYRGWNSVSHLTASPVEVTVTIASRATMVNEVGSTSPVQRFYGVRDRLTYSWNGGSGGLPVDSTGRPTGTESWTSVKVESLVRELSHESGQVVETQQFHRLQHQVAGQWVNLVYDPSSAAFDAAVDPAVNCLSTKYRYDANGRRFSIQRPDGTIEITVFDSLGRTKTVWRGTNASGVMASDPSTIEAVAGVGSNNMVQVIHREYDGNAAGDGNLTLSMAVTGNDAQGNPVGPITTYGYDGRNRLIAVRSPNGTSELYKLDNGGRRIATYRFSGASLSSLVGAALTHGYDFAAAGISSNLRGRSESLFDAQGLVYRSHAYEVNPINGSVGKRLTSNVWYDLRGDTIKTASPNGLFQKTQYDGAGRAMASFISYQDSESSWADAGHVSGDTVLSQQKMFYVGDRTAGSVSYQRSAATGSGATGELTAPDTLSGTVNDAYVQASGQWYDAAGRPIVSVNFGRDTASTRYIFNADGTLKDNGSVAGSVANNGIPDVLEGTALGRDSVGDYDYIWSGTSYDAAGRVEFVTDNKGIKAQYRYDLLGRRTRMVENWSNGEPEAGETSQDRTTDWIYDPWGRLHILRAYNPTSTAVERQDTQYFYASDVDRSWVSFVVYPDSGNDRDVPPGSNVTDAEADFDWDSTGKGFFASGDPKDFVSTTHDFLGRTTSTTDQRGIVHTYSYDGTTGQLLSDVVTAPNGFGAVDTSVKAIGYHYDDQGRVDRVTTYNTSAANSANTSTIVNDVQLTFDGWGNVIQSQQAHGGPVVSGTLAVNYTYDDGASGNDAKYVRLSRVTYPNGRQVHYLYGTAGSADDRLSRVFEIGANNNASDSTYDARYAYIGTGTIIREIRANGTSKLDFDPANDGSVDKLDTFGRVVGSQWSRNTAPGWVTSDDVAYTYDANSNRTSRKTYMPGNGITSLYQYDQYYQEDYTYDGLNRLTGFDSSYKDVTAPIGGTTTLLGSQDWSDLDALGNWRGFKEDADGSGTDELVQTRGHNAANEINAIGATTGSNWVDPTYDAAGNMTSMPQPGNETASQGGVYDAWNRLVRVSRGGSDVAVYEFDGLGRRIESTAGGHTEHSYFNEDWQVIETRQDNRGTPDEQNIWSLRYVDALIRQDKRTIVDNGSTDNSFGTNGIMQDDINGYDNGRAIAVQSDGKVIVVGNTKGTNYSSFAIARYNADGTLDTTFSGDGYYTHDLSSGYDEAHGVAILSDGKIVVGGRSGTNSFVMRFNADGTLDTTFGTGSSGYAILNLSTSTTWDLAYDMIVDSSGRILLAGSIGTTTNDLFVARVLANGSGLDTSFGSNGLRMIDFGSGTENGNEVTIDSQGRIVIVGSSGNNIAIARLTSSGNLDTSFDGDGKLTLLKSGWADAQAHGVAIDAQDRILFSGYVGINTPFYHNELMTGRLNTDGTPDTAYSGDGYQTYWSGSTTQGYTVNLQTDGKIVVGGLIGYDAAVWRYDHTGELDTSFDTDGIRHTTLGIGNSGDRWLAVAHTGSHLFVGGFNDYNTNDGQDFAVMKLNAGVALNQTLYVQQDANFNVTSVTDANGNVLERYRYTPYGKRTVLSPTFSVKGQTDFAVWVGHQGGEVDVATGLMLYNIEGNGREYHMSLGRWAQRDWAGYVDGISLVQYVRGQPTKYTDPKGLHIPDEDRPPGSGIKVNGMPSEWTYAMMELDQIRAIADAFNTTRKRVIYGFYECFDIATDINAAIINKGPWKYWNTSVEGGKTNDNYNHHIVLATLKKDRSFGLVLDGFKPGGGPVDWEFWSDFKISYPLPSDDTGNPTPVGGRYPIGTPAKPRVIVKAVPTCGC